MSKQQASPHRAVLGAGLFLVLATGALVAAFYLFDGVGELSRAAEDLDLAATAARLLGQEPAVSSTPTTATSGADSRDQLQLQLPDGMPESFALRVWQEQVDSQRLISRLVSGEVSRFVVRDTEVLGDVSTSKVVVTLDDGTEVPGEFVYRRFGGVWFVATVRAEPRVGTPQTAFPSVEEVDVALLNTIIAEQVEHKTATEEYATGRVFDVDILAAEPGPNSARIPVVMNEDHERATADIIAIKQQVDGRPLWFLAGFNKTGSEPVKQ